MMVKTIKLKAMKKIASYFILFTLLVFLFGSCDKETTEGVSRVTKYATLKITGSQFMVVKVGGTFTDPGAVATVEGNPISVITSGSVNTATPGVYPITYTAFNADSFSVEETRYVGVIGPDADTADLSGTYIRTLNNAVANWTQVDFGLYICDNVGGVVPPSAAILPVYVFHTTGTTLVVPDQPVPNGYGTLYCSSAKLNPTGYEWVVRNFGFGTALRTFVKQ